MKDNGELARQAAPKGRLRVALNHGNAVLVARDAGGAASGVSVDLARAFAERLGVEPEFLHFERAGDVWPVAADDVWDLCFLAIDPLRGESIFLPRPMWRSRAATFCRMLSPRGLRLRSTHRACGSEWSRAAPMRCILHARKAGLDW